jgi:hypothetical protein
MLYLNAVAITIGDGKLAPTSKGWARRKQARKRQCAANDSYLRFFGLSQLHGSPALFVITYLDTYLDKGHISIVPRMANLLEFWLALVILKALI